MKHFIRQWLGTSGALLGTSGRDRLTLFYSFAAIAVLVVYLNFVAHGWSLAKAAAISPVLLYAVGLGGFVIRLGIIIALMALLRQFDWFSTIAFIAALVPATIALLVAEMKMLSGRLQVDMWSFPASGPAAGPVSR